jgi:TfoX/Sxy family transcriptional regulator of competence genes
MSANTSRDKALRDDADRLVRRTRSAISDTGGISEVKMFGGVGFLLNGNLVAGASKRGLLLRLGKERYAEALLYPGVTPMVMRGKEMPGYVYLDPTSFDDAALKGWLHLAISFVKTLPPKSAAVQQRLQSRQ